MIKLPETFRFWICPAMLGMILSACAAPAPRTFSGPRAYTRAQEIMEFGPRVSGTEANRKAGDWIGATLRAEGWAVTADEGDYMGVPVRNIAGSRGQGPIVIVGAHYDSRRCADQPDGGCAQPVPGANDGASGAAVLLELAHALDPGRLRNRVWLVFFDAEDNGRLDGWDWIAGSRQFALRVKSDMQAGIEFQSMVLLDMVGDIDQRFYFEGNSDPALRGEIWSVARGLGFDAFFVPTQQLTVLDDHIPFRDLGIPSVDIIDFDYPYWHTPADSLDKISAGSLERVGRTVEVWLEGGSAEDAR